MRARRTGGGFGARGRRARARRVNWPRLLMLLVCLAALVYSGARLSVYVAESVETRTKNKELENLYEREDDPPDAAPVVTIAEAPEEIVPETPAVERPLEYQKVGSSMLPALKKIYKKNKDLIGWLKIPSVVNLPVVYRDNAFYLTHGFDKEKNKAGALFLDQYHPLRKDSQYLVIHGHNMHDGTMFGLLAAYRNSEYVRAHGLVSWNTLYRKENYVIFAVLVVPGDVNAPDYLAYTGTPSFAAEAEFDEYFQTVIARSLFDIPIEVDASDAVLALSTCLEDDRLLVFCRRARAGETRDDLNIALDKTVRR